MRNTHRYTCHVVTMIWHSHSDDPWIIGNKSSNRLISLPSSLLISPLSPRLIYPLFQSPHLPSTLPPPLLIPSSHIPSPHFSSSRNQPGKSVIRSNLKSPGLSSSIIYAVNEWRAIDFTTMWLDIIPNHSLYYIVLYYTCIYIYISRSSQCVDYS